LEAAQLLGDSRVPPMQPMAREDHHALAQCASEDTNGSVASRCRRPLARAHGDAPVTVFVVPEGRTSPVPNAPFALLRADGMIRAGLADRRGAVFERFAPDGTLSLLVPAALAR
jgi:hypothetical protein